MERELKRYNITPIRELAQEEKEYIATEVVKRIETMVVKFDGEYVYNHIAKAKISLAKIPSQYTDVNYIVSNNSIYIREGRDIKKIDEILLHEIFHYIQCNEKDYNGRMPYEMGLCRLHAYKITGLAINEAAIQLISAIIFNNEQEQTNYFGINVKSIHNRYFPILCALLQQITYILGYEKLLKSILKTTDDFKEQFENFAGRKSYDFLRESFDKMMKARDNIAKDRVRLKKEPYGKKAQLLKKKIEINTKEIQNHFLAVQKLCYTEYFKPLLKKVKTKEELMTLKEEISKYNEHIGKIGEKNEFMIFAQRQIQKINKKIK